MLPQGWLCQIRFSLPDKKPQMARGDYRIKGCSWLMSDFPLLVPARFQVLPLGLAHPVFLGLCKQGQA